MGRPRKSKPGIVFERRHCYCLPNPTAAVLASQVEASQSALSTNGSRAASRPYIAQYMDVLLRYRCHFGRHKSTQVLFWHDQVETECDAQNMYQKSPSSADHVNHLNIVGFYIRQVSVNIPHESNA